MGERVGRLDGKAALIAGGTSGIGLAIAERFLGEGAQVVVTGLPDTLAERTGDRLRTMGDAHVLPVDVRDAEAIERSVSEAVDRLGRLDILVNNVGVGVLAHV